MNFARNILNTRCLKYFSKWISRQYILNTIRRYRLKYFSKWISRQYILNTIRRYRLKYFSKWISRQYILNTIRRYRLKYFSKWISRQYILNTIRRYRLKYFSKWILWQNTNIFSSKLMDEKCLCSMWIIQMLYYPNLKLLNSSILFIICIQTEPCSQSRKFLSLLGNSNIKNEYTILI